MRSLVLASFLISPGIIWSQATTPPPSVAAEDPADEIGKLKKNCPAHIMGCAEVLFTGQPIHIAAGSLAPQNGVGFGLAYVGHKTTDNWRISWNGDAVVTLNNSWRAGFYVKFVNSQQSDVTVQKGTKDAEPPPTELPEQPVIDVYAQTTSLNKLLYFGLGPDTTPAGRSFYGMTETIVGASGLKPLSTRHHIGIYGEVNGRFVDIRGSHGSDSPSINTVYTEATAPGLATQPFFMQLGAGARLRPSFGDDRFHLNYDFAYRPFIASDSHFSFQRFTADLSHQMSIYKKTTRLLVPRDTNGPDDCVIDPTVDRPRCPKATTRNLEGSIGVRFFTALSFTPGNETVPFYFQPTLGGGDINGNPALSSYPDYRFRAPNVMLVRESFEHSIGKLPIGLLLMADEGKVGLTRGDLGSSQWRHSFSAGITLRAGGFPMMSVMFSWGGNEGTHTIASINSSLLGSSNRPSLF